MLPIFKITLIHWVLFQNNVCEVIRGSRWGLMLSVNGPCSIVFNVEMLKILLFTVIEDLAVKCC